MPSAHGSGLRSKWLTVQKFKKELKRQLYQSVILIACLLVFMWWQVSLWAFAVLHGPSACYVEDHCTLHALPCYFPQHLPLCHYAADSSGVVQDAFVWSCSTFVIE